MRRAVIFMASLMLLIWMPGQSGHSSEPPVAVASIGPLHALLTQVTLGISSPGVLLPPGASPHHYALRPSDAMRLEQAAIVFWVGPALEGSLINPIRALGNRAMSVALMEADDVDLLFRREGGVTSQLPPKLRISADTDPHIWLDPRMASVTMGIMADTLAKTDPARATLYADNASAGQQVLRELESDVFTYLNPVRRRSYVVFHDAYQYFENRFDLRPMAIVSVDSDHPPGAKRIVRIRQSLRENPGTCIFVEPQFTPRVIETLREGTGAKLGILDPVGTKKDSGLAGYIDMIWQLARNMRQCLE